MTNRESITTVLFPNFQTEEPLDGPVSRRDIVWFAEEYPWLEPAEVEDLKRPKIVVEDNPVKTDKNWWGVYHNASSCTSLGRVFRGMVADSMPTLYRSRTIHHDYLWDEQALSGRAFEVVLDRFNNDELRFDEVAKFFIPQTIQWPGNKEDVPKQRLLIRDETGEWMAPIYGEVNNQVDKCILILGELATRTDLDNS